MILVTGATGLLGRHILFDLTQKGHSVRAIYRDETKIRTVQLFFDFYSQGNSHHFDKIEWIKGDVLDLVSLEDAFIGIEQVYHCAAYVSFQKKDFKKLIQINRLGTANVVNYALKFGVKKFAHVSSTAAIGGVENQLTTEATKWTLTPRTSGYAISKYNAEREVWRGEEEGLEVVIINPCVILGAGDYSESSLTIFKSVQNGLKVYSPGKNAVVDARDVSACLIQLMEDPISAERYLCIGTNLSFKELLFAIAKAQHKKPPFIMPPRWLASFIGVTNEFLSRIFNLQPSITRESAHSAYTNMTYSNEKLQSKLNHTYYSLEDSIQNVVAYQNWINKHAI